MLYLKSYLKSFWSWFQYVLKSFQADQCLIRASALTYVTALSIVPFLAVAFSISKGFGFQNTLYIKEFLLKLSAGREELVEHIINYINRTEVGTLGAVGVVILLFTVFTLLGTVEQTFNTIWGVRFQRSIVRKFSDYLSVTLVCPLLILVAISFTATLESSSLLQSILSYSVFSYMHLAFLKVMPFVLVGLAFFFMYVFMPNTKVNLLSTLGGAIIAGVLWQTFQKTFISYQIGVSKYNAIYGSFAQVPLFLIWLYLSWIIILFGAELSFGLQNFRSSSTKDELGLFDLELKEKVALTIMSFLVKNFQENTKMLQPEDLARKLNSPLKIINQILFVLYETDFIVKVSNNGQEGIALLRSPNSYTCIEFIRKIRSYGGTTIKSHGYDPLDSVADYFDQIYNELSNSKFNMSMAEFSVKSK